MVAHALEDAPIECCGMLATKDGTLAQVRRAKNKEASPYRFDIHPLETKRLLDDIEESGQELAGFYHSHTGSPAVPSPTDIRMMGPLFGPPYVHFVIGVDDPAKPEVRVWFIEGAETIEQQFEIVD